jgi:hypothetical protein
MYSGCSQSQSYYSLIVIEDFLLLSGGLASLFVKIVIAQFLTFLIQLTEDGNVIWRKICEKMEHRQDQFYLLYVEKY